MWKIFGLIVGPKLPNQKLKIGNCTIVKIDNQRVSELNDLRPPANFNVSTKEIAVISPIKKDVKSFHEFSLTVEGNTPLEIIEKANKELDIILAILSLTIGGMRYQAVIKQAIPPNRKKAGESIPSGILKFSIYSSSKIYEKERSALLIIIF